MKKTVFTIILMAVWAANMAAQSVDDLFKEFKDKSNVEYIEIPKAMMSMASTFIKKEDGSDVIKRVNHITILNIENDPQLCQDFARKNGGDCYVESSEGQGSTFSFTVPLKK